MRALVALTLCCALAAHQHSAAADQVEICYNYGCAVHAQVVFSREQLAAIEDLFRRVQDPGGERAAISRAVGLFEAFAGEQTPTWADRGGDLADAGVDGRMDCIDHSTNTTAYLRLLQAHGWLRFHRVEARVVRSVWIIGQHWTACIIDITTHEEYAVDSWFFDNGHPAAVLKLRDWLRGARPNG